ncbi:MAG: GNAT family N-acetyltransferase [Fluviicola sp.]
MIEEIRSPKTDAEWDEYYDLRFRVMRKPLGKPRGSERNEGDENGMHFALFRDSKICAIARLDKIDEQMAQVRFVAVETEIQGSGFGKKIMLVTEQKAKELGCSKMILHARDYACDFYRKLGYKEIGPSYKLFDVLQHFEFHKELG